MRVADGLGLGELANPLGDAGRRDLPGVGHARSTNSSGVDDAADEVAEEHPGPVGQHLPACLAAHDAPWAAGRSCR